MESDFHDILFVLASSDYMLYDHFFTKFLQVRENFGSEKLSRLLRDFERLYRGLVESCVVAQTDNRRLKGRYRMAMNMALGYLIDGNNEDFCKYYAISEPFFALEIYDRQKKLMGIPTQEVQRDMNALQNPERIGP
jgi:hypothetical protein